MPIIPADQKDIAFKINVRNFDPIVELEKRIGLLNKIIVQAEKEFKLADVQQAKTAKLQFEKLVRELNAFKDDPYKKRDFFLAGVQCAAYQNCYFSALDDVFDLFMLRAGEYGHEKALRYLQEKSKDENTESKQMEQTNKYTMAISEFLRDFIKYGGKKIVEKLFVEILKKVSVPANTNLEQVLVALNTALQSFYKIYPQVIIDKCMMILELDKKWIIKFIKENMRVKAGDETSAILQKVSLSQFVDILKRHETTLKALAEYNEVGKQPESAKVDDSASSPKVTLRRATFDNACALVVNAVGSAASASVSVAFTRRMTLGGVINAAAPTASAAAARPDSPPPPPPRLSTASAVDDDPEPQSPSASTVHL